MTIKEIAKLAGVSISTVSKIVNNKDQNINQETRNRVLKIVKDYNYTPYGAVKNISNAKTFLLAVLLQDTSNCGRMLNGILEAAQEYGYRIILFDSRHCLEEELKHITFLAKNKVDGILWEPVCSESLNYEQQFTEAQIPVCHLHSALHNHACSIDYQRIGYLCAEKLISYKHHKICCLMKKNSFRSEQVFEGFKKCLFDYRLSYEDSMELYSLEPNSVSDMISHGYTGVISTHFASSLWLYKEMNKLHYDIPSDLSLISLRSDGREFICYPPISSFEIPYYDFGWELCKKLIHMCEKTGEEGFFSFSKDYIPDHEESLAIPSNFRKKKIIVVGSINTDITFKVDKLPQTGESVLIKNSIVCPGGKGANQAVGSARLGHEVALIGKIGNDMESNFIFDTLEKERVNTAGIRRDTNTQTGKAYIYIPKDGDGTITILPGANTLLSSEDLQALEYLFTNSDFCLLSTEISIDTVLEAAALAKKHGGKIILKPAALTDMPKCLYKQTDIFIPNEKEAALLAPHCTALEEQADFFFDEGIPTVIITLGHKGCYLKTKNKQQYFPAADFSSVDTTGGADAFICALAVYLSDGYSTEIAVRIAQYAAGFCISRQGVTPALIDKTTLHSHISQFEPELLCC